MSNLLDRICKLRDILEKKQYEDIGQVRQLATKIFDDLHLHMTRKSKDYSYELEFTSQDLRETAKAIGDTFKRWDNIMNPEKQIKKLAKDAKIIKEEKKKIIDFNPFMDETLPIMRYRANFAQPLTELKSLLEYLAVFLYYIEDVSNDNFAINYTERVVK